MGRLSDLTISLADRVNAFVDAEFARETAFLAELVKVASDNPPGDCAPHAARSKVLLEQLGLAVEVHRRAGGGGRGRRHEERDQSHRAPPLRRRAGDRAQRPWRCRAARPRLVARSLRRRDRGRSARRRHVRPRRRGVEVGFRHLHVGAAGAEGGSGRGREARRHGRAALHLRRGGGRRDRSEMAARSGPDKAGLRHRGRLCLRDHQRAQRLPAPRGHGDRQAGARRDAGDRPRCAGSRDRHPGGAVREPRRDTRRRNPRVPGISHADAERRPDQGRHQHQRGAGPGRVPHRPPHHSGGVAGGGRGRVARASSRPRRGLMPASR